MLIAVSHAVQSQEMEDFSFEQLLDLEVSVASSHSENLLRTPAIVSRINVEDVRNMGVHTLSDVLSILPGVQVQGTGIGTNAIMIRGMFEAFNQKVMFLLDGTPYYQPSHSDVPLAGIPLESIDRIEVIRGPGTIFHGSNASLGVINIITKKQVSNSLSLSASHKGGYRGEFYSGFEVATGTLSISGHYGKEGDYDAYLSFRSLPPFLPADTPTEGFIEKQTDDHSVKFSYSKNELYLSYHEFRSKNDGLAAAASILNVSEMLQEGRLFQFKNAWLTQTSELEAYLNYNNYFLEIPTEKLFAGVDDGSQNFGNGSDNVRIHTGLRYTKQASENSEYLVGAEVERRKVGNYLNSDAVTGEARLITMPSSDELEWSAYAQWLRDFDSHRLSVGFRYVDNDNSGNNFLPRASWVYSFSEDETIKLVYSNGFNSPNFLQRAINIPPGVIVGNPELRAERTETVDLAYTQKGSNHLFVANAFWVQAKHFIQRTSVDFAVTFQNKPAFNRFGIELDYQYRKDDINWMSSLTYQHKGNKQDTDDIGRLFVPEIMASIGMTYQLSPQDTFGVNYNYQSDRAAADDSHFITAQYTRTYDNVTLSFAIENLFGDDHLVQDIQDFNPARLIQTGYDEQLVRIAAKWQF